MQPPESLRHLKHVFRVALLLVLLVVVFVLGRYLFIPPSWGMYGFYRGDNLAEQKAHPVRHGGDASCRPCHKEQFATHEGGPHKTVRCEVCHAPVSTHVSGDKKTADMVIKKDVELCAVCHRKLSARPADFPQVELRQHVEGWGQTFSDQVCFMCHNPHKPL